MNKSISNISSFLKENYELITTCKQNCYISSSSLNYKCKKIVMEQHIYKAKKLQNIPTKLLQHIKDDFKCFVIIKNSVLRKKDFDNADYGIWDAVYSWRFIRKDKKWLMEVYISSILRRPFTIEQQKYYEDHCFGHNFSSRVREIFDSF